MQLAKAFGAKVTGVASTAKADLVRSIGADQVIDYTREDFADGRQHYDLILDIGGNSRLSRLRRALTPDGTLVIAGGEGGKWTGVGRQLRALMLSPVVPQRLTMYISAHRRLTSKHCVSKSRPVTSPLSWARRIRSPKYPRPYATWKAAVHKESSPSPSETRGGLRRQGGAAPDRREAPPLVPAPGRQVRDVSKKRPAYHQIDDRRIGWGGVRRER